MRLTLASALAASALTACSSPPPAPRCPTTVLPNCIAGPDRYADETCRAFDTAEQRTPAVADATRAPVVDAPTEGAALPGATPATFRWTAQLSRATPPGLAPYALPPVHRMTFRDELARFFTLLPAAEAHCLPFSGIGYALTFRAGATTVLRVEQSATEYTPDAAAWATLRAATGPLELTVLATRFNANAVTEGPYGPAAPRRFTIAP